MDKQIIEVNKEAGVYRITTLDERWYSKSTINQETGLPEIKFYPSATWIAGYYPKGMGFYKWLADKGWDEAEAIKSAAGDKGSKIHYACEDIDKGVKISIVETRYKNPSTGQEEALSPEEVEAIDSFTRWLDETQPILCANETVVFGDSYAGTIDRIYAIPNPSFPAVRQVWVLDIKSSKSIWEEYKIQLSLYSHASINYKSMGITDEEWVNRKLAILQVGYQLNKNRYKFTEIEDRADLAEIAKKLWANENPNAKPKQRDYPLFIEAKCRATKAENLSRIPLSVEEIKKLEENPIIKVEEEKVNKIKKTK